MSAEARIRRRYESELGRLTPAQREAVQEYRDRGPPWPDCPRYWQRAMGPVEIVRPRPDLL